MRQRVEDELAGLNLVEQLLEDRRAAAALDDAS